MKPGDRACARAGMEREEVTKSQLSHSLSLSFALLRRGAEKLGGAVVNVFSSLSTNFVAVRTISGLLLNGAAA